MASKPRVLIVEDNADLRRLYAIGLNQRGYEVKLAANGAEAMDRLENEKPDVVLLDLFMPLMNGWEVLERVNPPDREPTVPVIVVSGQLDSSDTRPHPSVAAWLSKPVGLEDLTLAIDAALRRQP